MHPQSEALASAFISDFWSANREIEWVAVEEERQLWLTPNTLLVGRVDARGRTSDGDLFFGEWKSGSAAKARRMAEEKVKWRTDPQALTYGVLLGGETNQFTVRWALKTNPVQTDFEWFTYTEAEIEHWRGQLLEIAHEIREHRMYDGVGPWRTNRGNCYRYGVKYACPFVDGCHSLDFNRVYGEPRTPHLAFERELVTTEQPSDLVIIDATRVGDYLECPEAYRKKWEGRGFHEESEALVIGSGFHELVANHLRALQKEKV
jgi:hypothetical protein